MKVPLEILTSEEFTTLGKNAQGFMRGGPKRGVVSKEKREAARVALQQYQIWQRSPLDEGTQRLFENAVTVWRNIE